jgi:hypothetical protein
LLGNVVLSKRKYVEPFYSILTTPQDELSWKPAICVHVVDVFSSQIV